MKKEAPINLVALRRKTSSAILTMYRSLVIAQRQQWIAPDDALQGHVAALNRLLECIPVPEATSTSKADISELFEDLTMAGDQVGVISR